MIPIHRLFHSSGIKKTSSSSSSYAQKFWHWTCQKREHWKNDKKEALIIFTVFGITGSTTLFFVRPCLKYMGIEGTLMDGPNSYRIASILIISPIYGMILLGIGTLAGRHAFFAKTAMRTIGRFLPNRVTSTILCPPAKELSNTNTKKISK